MVQGYYAPGATGVTADLGKVFSLELHIQATNNFRATRLGLDQVNGTLT